MCLNQPCTAQGNNRRQCSRQPTNFTHAPPGPLPFWGHDEAFFWSGCPGEENGQENVPRRSSPAASFHRIKPDGRKSEMENAEKEKIGCVCETHQGVLAHHTDMGLPATRKSGRTRPSGEPEARDGFHCDRRLFAPSRRNNGLSISRNEKEDMRHRLSADRHALTPSVVGSAMPISSPAN